MMTSAKGFVLLIVLIFITIFSALGLFGLQVVAQSLKANYHLWQRDKRLILTDQLLRGIENNILAGDAQCVIPVTSARNLAKQPMSWWVTSSCSGNLMENRYYYVVEPLGVDVCGFIDKVDVTHPVVADYYRISVCVVATEGNDKIIVQSTIAKAKQSVSSCASQPHVVMQGRQMWREI